MPKPVTTVRALTNELKDQVMVAIGEYLFDKLWVVYNVEQIMKTFANGIPGSPCAFILYDNTVPADGNTGVEATRRTLQGDTHIVVKSFNVIVAADYEWSSEDDGPGMVVTDLLDSVRGRLQGFVGVNGRPWRFASEAPVDIELDGVILYAQVWETTCIESGNTL